MLAAAAWDDEHLTHLRRLGPRAVLVVPLVAREQGLGVLALLLTQPGRQYGPPDVALAEELARRAALAVDNARSYEEMRAALRARDTFLSVASHELRTPVTSLKGQVQRLHRGAVRGRLDLEQVMDALPVLGRNIDRLELLIDDLLDAERLQQSRLQLHPQDAELGALVRDLLARYEVAPGRQVVLEGADMAAPVPVHVDAAWLEQVLTNLLDNAVKYSPTGGIIRVMVVAEGAGGRLSVQDEGIGIPPDQLDTIFEPFGRASNVAGRHLPGLGLGLYVARLIVEQHGGRIWAASAGTGQGAQVHVWLPSSPAALP
jgi:signal transduction histidine kinase